MSLAPDARPAGAPAVVPLATPGAPGASGPPALALVPPSPDPAPPRAAAALIFPDGVTVPRLARGIYRAPFLSGDSWVVFAVDSAADSRGLFRRVPVMAGAAGLHRAEAELAALLDALDPPPRPRLVPA